MNREHCSLCLRLVGSVERKGKQSNMKRSSGQGSLLSFGFTVKQPRLEETSDSGENDDTDDQRPSSRTVSSESATEPSIASESLHYGAKRHRASCWFASDSSSSSDKPFNQIGKQPQRKNITAGCTLSQFPCWITSVKKCQLVLQMFKGGQLKGFHCCHLYSCAIQQKLARTVKRLTFIL